MLVGVMVTSKILSLVSLLFDQEKNLQTNQANLFRGDYMDYQYMWRPEARDAFCAYVHHLRLIKLITLKTHTSTSMAPSLKIVNIKVLPLVQARLTPCNACLNFPGAWSCFKLVSLPVSISFNIDGIVCKNIQSRKDLPTYFNSATMALEDRKLNS